MPRYSDDRKSSVTLHLLPPENRTVNEVAQEEGISTVTLYAWRKQARERGMPVPGSGKTRTMMERIGILVNEYGIPPEHILGLTFTRNAADEMRSRLVPVLGDLSSRVRLSTIHSFCLHLLKVEGRVFEILSGKGQLIFIKNVMKRLQVKDLTVGTVLREISLAKNNIIVPTEFRDLFYGDKTMMQIADIYQAYDEAKVKETSETMGPADLFEVGGAAT